jgi:PAS domain S-box-containing protein
MSQRSLPEKGIHEERSKQTRQESRGLHESIIDASGLAVMQTTPEGLITGFNHAAENLMGYAAAEVIGKTCLAFHDADEVASRTADEEEYARQPFDLILHKARMARPPESCKWTFIRKDRSRFTGSLTVIPVRDNADSITGYAGIISDLSGINELKERLEISEQKFRLLAENITGAIYLCHNDPQYSIIYINDHIGEITGYAKEEFLSGRINIADLFHPDDRAMVFETVDRAVNERRSFRLQYRIRHRSGEWRWVDETGVGVFEGEKLAMLEGFLSEITHQKEAEEKLQKMSEENLRFFNNPVNLNAVIGAGTNLIRINPSWTKVLGWSQEELKAHPLLHLIHPEDLDRAKHEVSHLSKTGQLHTFEVRMACKDGSYRWLLWALSPDPVNNLVYASAVDISARKKSEETILDSKSNLEGITLQLQEQNRRLDEFAHIISHNLRAPVKNIQALIKLLDEHSEINDYRLIFDKLKNVAKNLNETMNELMDTLKAKTQPHVDLTDIRFKEVLDKVVQSLEGELIVAEASVTFDFNEAPVIRYSKPYLESIFQNLLTNAIKYRSSQRRPTVHFRSLLANSHLELQVTDNGQGIDMEKFGDKVFGLHKTFHDHQEARGVGLFLVKTQVEALGGSISVKSEVDKGTTFTIRFN